MSLIKYSTDASGNLNKNASKAIGFRAKHPKLIKFDPVFYFKIRNTIEHQLKDNTEFQSLNYGEKITLRNVLAADAIRTIRNLPALDTTNGVSILSKQNVQTAFSIKQAEIKEGRQEFDKKIMNEADDLQEAGGVMKLFAGAVAVFGVGINIAAYYTTSIPKHPEMVADVLTWDAVGAAFLAIVAGIGVVIGKKAKRMKQTV